MSVASSLPYKLRPNKAADREIFLSLLNRINGTLSIENYTYVGLGGPFLEDFRLLHARIGIRNMVCIEVDENVHKRQKFNKPFDRIDCIHSTIEEYVAETEFNDPIIIWFDFTDPKEVTNQIELFSNVLLELPSYSIMRVTLNANPASLGKPDPTELAVNRANGEKTDPTKKTELEWRLDRFRERLSTYCPADIVPEDLTHRNYGKTILEALRLSVENSILNSSGKRIVWSFATHYSDGQPMVTATLILVESDDAAVESVLDNWEFKSNPQHPLVIDLPALSALERLTMEANETSEDDLGFKLPKSDLKEDPFLSFQKYYRIFPQFARVDI
ncbi:MAG: O-methyltransferase [Pseudomonadota bacterium]